MGGMGGGGGGGGRGGGRGNFQTRAMIPSLDDQQRQLFREALNKDREAMTKLNEQLQSAQKELMQAAIAENYDEKVVAQKADAVAKIQSALMLIRARAFSALAPTLKPEQRQELEDSRMGQAILSMGVMDFGGGGMGRMGPGFGGGGGGGGGRVRGGGGGGAGGGAPPPAAGGSQPPTR
jgi:Spy/CpxP family protein refolding chaperone